MVNFVCLSLQPLPTPPLFSGRANQQQTLPQDSASAELPHAFRIRRETALTSCFPHPPATFALSVTSFRNRDSWRMIRVAFSVLCVSPVNVIFGWWRHFCNVSERVWDQILARFFFPLLTVFVPCGWFVEFSKTGQRSVWAHFLWTDLPSS